jgi:hypothetical protein
MTIYKTKRYGWRRDHLDPRDHMLTVAKRVSLPTACDLRTSGFLPPVYDQGQLESCTANATAAVADVERKKQAEQFLMPSRLFLYYNERVIENEVNQDSGAELRDGMKTVAEQGACAESEWPYDVSQFAVKPPDKCYTHARKFKALHYAHVPQTSYYIRYCLAILARPIAFGISAFSGLESDQAAAPGIVPCRRRTTHPSAVMRFVWWAMTIPSSSSLFAIRGEKAEAIKATGICLRRCSRSESR